MLTRSRCSSGTGGDTAGAGTAAGVGGDGSYVLSAVAHGTADDTVE